MVQCRPRRLMGRPGKFQHPTFGRVMYHAKVWLNGRFLGENVGGYLSFALDVTDKLGDAANHLVLRVDNRPRIDWLPAAKQIEWVQYGGILQPVRVETTERIFLSDLAIQAIPKGEGASVSCSIALNNSEEADASDVVLKISILGGEHSEQTSPLAQASVPASVSMLARDIPPETVADARPCRALVTGVTRPLHLDRDFGRRNVEIDRVGSPFGVRTIERAAGSYS